MYKLCNQILRIYANNYNIHPQKYAKMIFDVIDYYSHEQ